jgi:hypothetical protein
MIAIRYSTDLQKLKTIKHGHAYVDRCFGVGVDSEDNYIMAGSGYSGNYYTDMWLVKSSASGSLLWSKFLYGESAQSSISGYNVEVLADDSFWIVGSDAKGSAHQDQIYIGYFDKNGGIIKDTFLNPYPGRYDSGLAIDLDALGNVYIAGHVNRPDYRGYIAKLDPDLNLVWEKEISGAYRGFLYDLKVYDNSVYAAGRVDETSTDFRAVLYKYDLDGNEDWAFEYDGAGPSDNFIDLVKDEAGFLLSGTQKDADGKFAMTLYRFDNDLNHIYTAKADMGAYSGAGYSLLAKDDFVSYQTGYNNYNGPGRHNWHVVKWSEVKTANVTPTYLVGEEEAYVPADMDPGCDDDLDNYCEAGMACSGDFYVCAEGLCTDCNDADLLVNPAATEECNGIDDNCSDEVDEPVCGGPTDADCDSVSDCSDDLCPDTVEWFAEKKLNPDHYDSSNLDITRTFGCGCDQIVNECMPGGGKGLIKHGCPEDIITIFEAQTDWASGCFEL